MKIILYFISILHVILKKSVRNFSFFKLFCSVVRNENIKRPGFYMLQVARNFSNFPQLKQLYLSWRPELVIRNLIVIMLLSVSYDYVFEYRSSCNTVVS